MHTQAHPLQVILLLADQLKYHQWSDVSVNKTQVKSYIVRPLKKLFSQTLCGQNQYHKINTIFGGEYKRLSPHELHVYLEVFWKTPRRTDCKLAVTLYVVKKDSANFLSCRDELEKETGHG